MRRGHSEWAAVACLLGTAWLGACGGSGGAPTGLGADADARDGAPPHSAEAVSGGDKVETPRPPADGSGDGANEGVGGDCGPEGCGSDCFEAGGCQQEVDACAALDCANATACVDVDGTVACQCEPGWQGARCDENIDDCAAAPCVNATACVDEVAGFRCECDAGWAGERCDEAIDECAPGPCVHATECVDGVGAYHCVCEPGWEGERCDHNVDECAANPCVNATACVDAEGDYRCECEAGWFGKNCDVPCDDGDEATVDSLDPVRGCGHRTGDWTVYDDGTEVDHLFGLVWYVWPGPIGYAAFFEACDELELGGRSDWRVPTIDETRTWAAGCQDTVPEGSCPIEHEQCLDEACGIGAGGNCTPCTGGQGPHPHGGYCRPEIRTCTVLWTDSPCTDCSNGEVWFYGVSNANFTRGQPTGGRRGACVADFDG